MEASLKLGNGDWGVKNDSLLAYDDFGGKFRPLPFDFTRASSATVVNKQGLIETVQSGIPRIDFSDDANGALKLEPQSTNLLRKSEEFYSIFVWSVNGGSVSNNILTSPDGNQTSSLFSLNGASNGVYQTYSTSIGFEYTFSVFIKPKGGANRVNIAVISGRNVLFDTVTGTVISNSTGLIYKSVFYANTGYWRLSVTDTAIATSSVCNIYSGANSLNEFYAWGAQVEQHSYSTSYIPTSGAIATRNQELCNNATPVINSTEGVLYLEASALANGGVGDRSISLGDGGYSNKVELIYHNTPNRINFRVTLNGSLDVNISDFTFNQEQLLKIACKFSNNDFALWINGVKRATNITAVMPIGLNELSFNSTSTPFFGNTKDLKYYPKALADVQLEDLTTI